MATELGSAYISVGLGTNSLAGDIKKAFGSAESSGKSAGAASGRGFMSGFKGLVGAGIALAGAGIFSGFVAEAARASDATDKFKATMSFAGLKTDAIDAATKSAKAYADATVYDLPTIQNTIAQLASNGVKDYKGLTEAAGNLNAVAGGNADTFGSVAMVLTQTAGAGKLTTENWNQLADAIPGAAGPLMKALEGAGAYTGNFRDAMAKGQITSEEFNAALSKLGKDPVAVEAAKSTKTFEGAIGNLEATINSGLMGALDALKPAITGVINLMSGGLGKAFEFVGNAATGLFDLFAKGDFTGALSKAFNVEEDSKLVDVLFRIRDAALVVVGGFRAFGAAWKENNGDVTSDGFAGVMERIANGLREATGGVRAFFAAFADGGDDITSSGFAGVLEGFGLQARKVFDAVGPMISQAIATVGPLVASLAASFAPMMPMFAALVPQVFALFQALSPTSLLFQALVPVLPQIAAAIGSVLQSVLPLALSLGSQLLPIITQLITAVLPPLINIFTNIVTAIAPLITQIAGLLIPIIQALMPVVVTVFGVIASVITSVMQIVQGVIQVVTGIITGNWQQVWDGIVNILKGSIDVVVNVITGIKDIVLGALSGAGKWLVDVGGQIIQGLLDGLGNAGAAIGSFFLGLLPGWIVEPFKMALGIHSPSRVFAGFGENIGQGLINGIDSMDKKIQRTTGSMVSVPPVPRLGVSGASSFGGSALVGAGAGRAAVVQNIHPSPGMSEAVIGNIAANSLNRQLRSSK